MFRPEPPPTAPGFVPPRTTSGFAAPKRSPRLTPREVVASARGEAGLRSKGRPPEAAKVTTLSAEARAMLARCSSDQPPTNDGFGGKVSSDGAELVTIFPGAEVPPRLQLPLSRPRRRRLPGEMMRAAAPAAAPAPAMLWRHRAKGGEGGIRRKASGQRRLLMAVKAAAAAEA